MKMKISLLTSILVSFFMAVLLITTVNARTRDTSTDYSSQSDIEALEVSTITEADCRLCHEDLVRFPGLTDTNIDKHHLLVGDEIPPLSIVPYETSSIYYECLSCHLVEQIDVTEFQVTVERDCLQCHPVETVSGPPSSTNVHHELPSYACRDCHDRGPR